MARKSQKTTGVENHVHQRPDARCREEETAERTQDDASEDVDVQPKTTPRTLQTVVDEEHKKDGEQHKKRIRCGGIDGPGDDAPDLSGKNLGLIEFDPGEEIFGKKAKAPVQNLKDRNPAQNIWQSQLSERLFQLVQETISCFVEHGGKLRVIGRISNAKFADLMTRR